MEIIYTQNSVEGEPGPNLYWRGNPKEFLQLLTDIHSLGVSPGIFVHLEEVKYVRLNGLRSYKLCSSKNGTTLICMENGAALTDLNPKLWREFLHKVLSISFLPSFVYQELSASELALEINIIMSSEATGAENGT